jgi:hypothetical protein
LRNTEPTDSFRNKNLFAFLYQNKSPLSLFQREEETRTKFITKKEKKKITTSLLLTLLRESFLHVTISNNFKVVSLSLSFNKRVRLLFYQKK